MLVSGIAMTGNVAYTSSCSVVMNVGGPLVHYGRRFMAFGGPTVSVGGALLCFLGTLSSEAHVVFGDGGSIMQRRISVTQFVGTSGCTPPGFFGHEINIGLIDAGALRSAGVHATAQRG